MLNLGIAERNESLIYEGDYTNGHGVWPSPTLSIATLLQLPIDTKQVPSSSYLSDANYVFREDSFDPVTRIRRGRLYKASNTRPEDWWVQPHPAYFEEANIARLNGSSGRLRKRILSFEGLRVPNEHGKLNRSALIALGTSDAFTLWRIIDVERIVTGEDLLTLRARNSLGALPELNLDAIPKNGLDKLKEVLERLDNSAHRAGPEDIIESARAATQWSLGMYLAARDNDPKMLVNDLGELIKHFKDRRILHSLIPIMASLHSRAKPNEQERYDTRPLMDGDGEYALVSVGLILRELGWTI